MLSFSESYLLPLNYFSPNELLAQIKKPLNLPLHAGPKAFAPDENNEEEDAVLKSILEEQRDVLKEQRIHKKYIFKICIIVVLNKSFLPHEQKKNIYYFIIILAGFGVQKYQK